MIETILFYLVRALLYSGAFALACAGAVGIFGTAKLAYGYLFGKYRRPDV